MVIELTDNERNALRVKHRIERDGRIRDRIKVVLLKDKGWTDKLISEALLLDENTVNKHIHDYKNSKKLKPDNGGSFSKLTQAQTQSLIGYLTEYTYASTKEIRAYVYKTYGIMYTQQGMHDWLIKHKFSYKKPKGVPSKADPEKQAAFIKEYEEIVKQSLSRDTADEEPIFFMDSVHPTMSTKMSHGWIRIGHENDKAILTTGSRTRINLTGALNLERMEIFTRDYKTIDQDATVKFLERLREKHSKARKLHVILDNGPAHNNAKVLEFSQKIGIELHFLPTYSPNLNPIERVWKIMNEKVRNNVFFKRSKDFFDAIHRFFEITWPRHCHEFIDRVNDNFETISFANSLKLFKPPPSG
eukprot:TRINITY_DN1834_c0_g2_i10.p1 TRINITY_DN1834_c0_g2~~TRINITY_DN1834_c0_g2_i10.p1  ORF type:complete len:359 (+),score=20.60 TRINITY_DN1834_c0_g2_i10:725-1801(+)